MAGVSVWHPFWLPKMVLDGVEQKKREKLRREWEANVENGGQEELGQQKPLWSQDEQWGNDGLVTVQSSRWGEFLGILEGCDHWEMRGARGIDLSVDLKAVPLGIGSTGDGWGLKDWGNFVGAWKKEERRAQAQAATDGGETKSTMTTAAQRGAEQVREREQADAVIKSSTDKFSAVFDWLVEQVPAPSSMKKSMKSELAEEAEAKAEFVVRGRSDSKEGAEMRGRYVEMRERRERRGRTNELETKMGLERFYVALSRKLYDEGL